MNFAHSAINILKDIRRLTLSLIKVNSPLSPLNRLMIEYYLIRIKRTSDDQKKWNYYSKKHNIIIHFIDKHLSKYRLEPENTGCIGNEEKDVDNYPIWVFWWQGKDKMPDVVRVCFNSIIQNSNSHPVIFIDKDNFKEYVFIEESIYNKFGIGLTVTQFSDIIRLKLLSIYGGLWLDSTVLLTSKLPNNIWGSSLFTIKNEARDNECVGEYRWAVNCLFVPQNSIYIKNIYKMFSSFWTQNKLPLDYLFIDYCFEYELRNNSNFRALILDLPINNINYHSIRENLNNTYKESDYKEWIRDTHFHKLTYKGEFRTINRTTGRTTYYGFLVDSLRNDNR